MALPAAFLIVSSVCAYAASRVLAHGMKFLFAILVGIALVLTGLAPAFDAFDHLATGLRPDASAYGAIVFLFHLVQAEVTAPVLVIGCFGLARLRTGKLDHQRRAVFDNLALLLHYSVAQGLVGLVLIHGFPGVAQP